MDPDEARRRFEAAPVARLATVTPDGRPRLVPITFAMLGDIVFTPVDHKPKTTRRLARLADIAAEPRVALLADHYDNDWQRLWWVRADGVAVELPPELATAATILEPLAAKYPQYREQPPDGPMISISVTRWSGWSAT